MTTLRNRAVPSGAPIDAPPRPAEPVAAATPARRDPWLDNIKLTTAAAVLLALVLAAPSVARMLDVAVDPVGWLVRHRRGREPATA